MSEYLGSQLIAGATTNTTLKALRNVGDIFFTSRKDVVLNGAVECNGSEFDVRDFIGTESIGALLSSNKLPYLSYANYQAEITAHGCCGSFAYDGGNTFKVPTLNAVYLAPGAVGEFEAESLPNIEGKAAGNRTPYSWDYCSGSFYNAPVTTVPSSSYGASLDGSLSGRSSTLGIDASRSSSVYQNGAHVKPNTVKYRAMVQLTTGNADNCLVDLVQVRAELATLNALPHIKVSVETATGGYNVYSNGYYEEWGHTTSGNWTLVQLSKVFKNNNYSILLGGNDPDRDTSLCTCEYNSKTVSSFYVGNFYNGYVYGQSDWKVSGFLAEGQY